MKTGVYCGSFAPVHNGHTAVMNAALNYCDRVIVVPTMDYWNKHVSISLEKRIKCLKLFETDKIMIDQNLGDIYSEYTSDLLRRLQARYPEDELYLIIGADNVKDFYMWHDVNYILNNHNLLIMRRDDINIEEDAEEAGIKNYTIMDAEQVYVSSSYIRENLDQEAFLIGDVDYRVIEILKEGEDGSR